MTWLQFTSPHKPGRTELVNLDRIDSIAFEDRDGRVKLDLVSSTREVPYSYVDDNARTIWAQLEPYLADQVIRVELQLHKRVTDADPK